MKTVDAAITALLLVIALSVFLGVGFACWVVIAKNKEINHERHLSIRPSQVR